MDFRFSITHNGIVRYLHNSKGRTHSSLLGVEREEEKYKENLNKGFKHNGELSLMSKKKIINRILWLNQIAEVKTYKTKKGQFIQHKLSMLTLTLPSKMQHSPQFITENCLTKFLNLIRSYYKIKNYIWKLELQQNGNVHYHIITDAELDYNSLKKIWNKIINKFGYVDEYSKNSLKLGERKYIEKRLEEMRKYKKYKLLNESNLIKEIKEVWRYQKSINFSEPNTINIKRISLNSNIENYIAKYVSKGSNSVSHESFGGEREEREEEEKKIGRIYSNSENLSKVSKLKDNIQDILKFSYHYFSEVWHFKRIDYDYFNFVPIKLNNAIKLLKELRKEIELELEKIGLTAYEEPLFDPLFGLTDVLEYLE